MARKILLADDSVTAQNMGRKILADAGYEVITVNNGSAALKKIAESRPDVIVLDVYMPGYSGLEVCQRLKEAQETSRIPILLTVGKLEPFKPEEAKRVRAEAFIVKPFEASELLAALTKLEDKIVPRSEPSKPGRFARANAALDEGRYDKTVSIEEDSGWKDRISFPSKKKKKIEEENGEDPAIYNAVNKDLRTTVEHKPEPIAHQTPVEESKVDLGALAPEGLPKDVTPEEIAALAAAAAQVKGKLADAKWDEAAPEQSAAAPVEVKPAAGDTGEIKASETQAITLVEAAAEDKSAVKEAATPAAEAAPEVSAPPVAAFAEQSSGQDQEHKIEAPAEKPAEVAQEAAQEVASHAAEATVEASAAPVPTAEIASASQSNLSEFSAPRVEEPVAVAAAAAAGISVAPSRWSAVAVALDAGESSVSLDEEMQKAHAAFAAAEAAQAASVTAVPAGIPPVAVDATPLSAESFSPVEAVTPELLGSASIPVPEAEKAPSAEASIAETVTPVVKSFETVAPRDIAPEPIYASAIAEPAAIEPAPVPSPPEPEAQSSVEEKPQEIVSAEEPAAKAEAEEAAKDEVPSPALHERSENLEAKAQESEIQEPAQPVAEAAVQTEQEPEPHVEESEVEAASLITQEAPAVAVDAGDRSNAPAKESEIVDTTAAAWASWRRIRESGDSRPKSAESSNSSKSDSSMSEEESMHAAAAMAAAAGAERTPEDAARSGEPDDIANIVDGVLADLRPKIVAEISKKLGKKKK